MASHMRFISDNVFCTVFNQEMLKFDLVPLPLAFLPLLSLLPSQMAVFLMGFPVHLSISLSQDLGNLAMISVVPNLGLQCL